MIQGCVETINNVVRGVRHLSNKRAGIMYMCKNNAVEERSVDIANTAEHKNRGLEPLLRLLKMCVGFCCMSRRGTNTVEESE